MLILFEFHFIFISILFFSFRQHVSMVVLTKFKFKNCFHDRFIVVCVHLMHAISPLHLYDGTLFWKQNLIINFMCTLNLRWDVTQVLTLEKGNNVFLSFTQMNIYLHSLHEQWTREYKLTYVWYNHVDQIDISDRMPLESIVRSDGFYALCLISRWSSETAKKWQFTASCVNTGRLVMLSISTTGMWTIDTLRITNECKMIRITLFPWQSLKRF